MKGMLSAHRPDIHISSAGTLDGDRVISPEVLAALGADATHVAGHRSRTLRVEDVRQANVILAMAREHLREVVVLEPNAWERTFTLKELVRRGEAHRARAIDEPLQHWLHAVGQGRNRMALLGDDPSDDVVDPINAPPERLAATAAEIRDLCARLVALMVPPV